MDPLLSYAVLSAFHIYSHKRLKGDGMSPLFLLCLFLAFFGEILRIILEQEMFLHHWLKIFL